MSEPIAVSVVEATRLTGLGRSTLYAEIQKGNLKLTKVGARSLIKMSDLRAWLDAKSEG